MKKIISDRSFTLRLPDSKKSELMAIARRQKTSAGDLARQAIDQYIRSQKAAKP